MKTYIYFLKEINMNAFIEIQLVVTLIAVAAAFAYIVIDPTAN